MMDWNVVILSKIKKLLTNITSIQSLIGTAKDSGGSTTNGTIMAKENAILTAVNKIGTANDTGGSTTAGTILGKENAILTKVNSISTATNKIGATGDTGGSTTAGTVMGKCNAILNSIKGIHATAAQKGALKETGTKRVSYPTTDSNKVMEFDFGKEVQFVALYMKPKLSTDIYGNAHTIYFINGENSLHTTFKFLSTGEFVYPVINIGSATVLRTNGLLFGLLNSLGEDAALFQFPIYVTKIRIEFAAAALKSNYVDLSVTYIG